MGIRHEDLPEHVQRAIAIEDAEHGGANPGAPVLGTVVDDDGMLLPMADAHLSVTLELPWPPSVNHYWRHVTIPLSKVRCRVCNQPAKIRSATLISADGREWLQTVGRLLYAMKLPLMHGSLALEAVLHPPTRRSFDVDNRAKSLLDALKPRNDPKQLAWLFAEDDSQVERLTLIKGPRFAPAGKCIVTVTPLRSAQGELFV